MSAAWHGGLTGAEQWVQDPALLAAISSAMDFWFENDFQDPSCLDSGGDAACPCGTPGFWNTNWFSNVCFLYCTRAVVQHANQFVRRLS